MHEKQRIQVTNWKNKLKMRFDDKSIIENIEKIHYNLHKSKGRMYMCLYISSSSNIYAKVM